MSLPLCHDFPGVRQACWLLALLAVPFCVAAQVPASSGKPNTGAPIAAAPTTPNHAAEIIAAPEANAAAVEPAPDIALLLPLESPDFRPAAAALQRGFQAALDASGSKLVAVAFPTDSDPKQVLVAYLAALKRGAKVIVGPMTRSAVSALAVGAPSATPTLALNAPDAELPMPQRFYWFGLSNDVEARQIASLAKREDQKFCFVVYADTPLERRAAQAFTDAYQADGGKVLQTMSFSPSETAFPQIRDRLANFESGCAFLAADTSQARLIRPYLSNSLTVYATSLINLPGALPRDNVDLNGIRFADMPWLLQPDHPAVMVYPRPGNADRGSLERFYALGIDAFRIAVELMRSPPVLRLDLDGVTGRIRVGPNNQILREPTPAIFRDGVAVPQDDAK